MTNKKLYTIQFYIRGAGIQWFGQVWEVEAISRDEAETAVADEMKQPIWIISVEEIISGKLRDR